MIMKQTCENCKHWEGPDNMFDVKNIFGHCNSDKFFYADNLDKTKLNYYLDSLEYSDYEGYSAGFRTGKNFGCIHFSEMSRPKKAK